MMLKKKMKTPFLTIVLLVLVPLWVHAAPFGFTNITSENSGDAAIGEAQLFVNVTDPGASQVLFTFTNIGPDLCSIADVYFEENALLEIASIDNSDPGVLFSQHAKPAKLPGRNNVSPPFVTDFSADSDPPVEHNGVGPGESLGILFNLQSAAGFSDVLADLGSRDLRIGIHVQGFASKGSESFINIPTQIPIPATMLLLGSGLMGLMGFRMKFRK